MSNWFYKSAIELACAVRDRQVGCLELLDLHLERVRQHNEALNAIVVLDAARARARAKQADAAVARGDVLGPLHGVPMTVKESFDVAGLPTTWGVPALRDNIATANAAAVNSLLKAGAIIFGKTNVPLYLSDWQSFNAIYGSTSNPWDQTRTPGGSSGGAAASLAAGMSALEIGSDVGSSIRCPAHFCGVYGHKPSYGIVPQDGHWIPGGLAPLDMWVCGPLARSAEDLSLALELIAGPGRMDRTGWKLNLPELAGWHLRISASRSSSTIRIGPSIARSPIGSKWSSTPSARRPRRWTTGHGRNSTPCGRTRCIRDCCEAQ